MGTQGLVLARDFLSGKSHNAYAAELDSAHKQANEAKERFQQLSAQVQRDKRQQAQVQSQLDEAQRELASLRAEVGDLRYDPFANLTLHHSLQDQVKGLSLALEREKHISAGLLEDLQRTERQRITIRERDSAVKECDRITLELSEKDYALKNANDALQSYALLVRKMEGRKGSNGDIQSSPLRPVSKEQLDAQKLQRQNEILTSKLSAERSAHEKTKEELSKLRAEHKKSLHDERAAARMVSLYMSEAQNSQNNLFDILYTLQSYHKDEMNQSRIRVDQLQSQMLAKDKLVAKMTLALDNMTSEADEASLRSREATTLRTRAENALSTAYVAMDSLIQTILAEIVAIRDGPANALVVERLDKMTMWLREMAEADLLSQKGLDQRLSVAENIIQALVVDLTAETARRIAADKQKVDAEKAKVKVQESAMRQGATLSVPPSPALSARHSRSLSARRGMDLYPVAEVDTPLDTPPVGSSPNMTTALATKLLDALEINEQANGHLIQRVDEEMKKLDDFKVKFLISNKATPAIVAEYDALNADVMKELVKIEYDLANRPSNSPV